MIKSLILEITVITKFLLKWGIKRLLKKFPSLDANKDGKVTICLVYDTKLNKISIKKESI